MNIYFIIITATVPILYILLGVIWYETLTYLNRDAAPIDQMYDALIYKVFGVFWIISVPLYGVYKAIAVLVMLISSKIHRFFKEKK